MKYKQAVSWLNSLQRFGIKLGLQRIEILVEKLGNPEKKYLTIHVGGTNGKGSVCNYIASILEEAGYKVGVYTSPHLVDFSERIKVNKKNISKKQVTNLVKKIKPIVGQIIKEKPTYFEITTAMAFEFFKQQKIDIAIIEVGLGGKYDATNIIKPMASVITNISLEHQNILGETINEISEQKAGIIKEKIPIITAVEKKSLKIIQKKAVEKKSQLIIVSKRSWERQKNTDNYQVFKIKGKTDEYKIKTNLLGGYQGENIALSINTVEALKKQGLHVLKKHIMDGIKKTSNNGRAQLIYNAPKIILDGAHNPDAIKKITDTVKNDFNYQKLILVIGILSDKNIKKMIQTIAPIADEIIVTQPKTPRAEQTQKIQKIIKEIDENKKIIIKKDVGNAVRHAKLLSKPDGLILVTGSLYTVGEAIRYLKN